MKFLLALTFLASALALLYSIGFRLNLTPSLPRGIYRATEGRLEHGSPVAFCLESPVWTSLARERGYLGTGSCPSGLRPLLKYLAGLPGDAVTMTPDGIRVEPVSGPARVWPAAFRREDSVGRPLPESSLRAGVIPAGMALALSDYPGSFDSRFFGLVPLTGMVRVESIYTFGGSTTMNREELNAVATDAFTQAQDGLAVPLDPEQAEGMGAFTEDALTLKDILDDALLAAEGGKDGRE